MKFYRLINNSTLHEFGKPISECLILGQRLVDVQTEYIQAIGGSVTDIESHEELENESQYFLFEEDVFFSLPFLKECEKIASDKEQNLQFALERNTFNERFVLPHPNDNESFHLIGFSYKSGNQPTEVVSVSQQIFEHAVVLPDQIVKGRAYHMDQCETFAAHIISPFHLLFVNLAMNLARTAKFQAKIPSFLKNTLATPYSKWYYKGLKRMNRFGNNCKIHPTAIIEGSVLGDNVIVEANAIVRLSTVGSDCHISDNVVVINSVLGEKTHIANCNYITSCLTYDEVFLIHGPYQFSIFGSKSACFAVINCDIRMDQENIKIPTTYRVIDSNQPLLGVAYGHNSKTAGGNIIAAGRIVPNNLHILPPDNIILNFKDK